MATPIKKPPFYKIHITLVSQFCLNELAVQAGDIGDGLVLRADGLASTGIGAVAEAGLFHSHYHC